MAKRGRPKTIDSVVNSPSHYLRGEIERMAAMVSEFGEEQVRIYAERKAGKYDWRAGKKQGATDTDLANASWYTNRAAGEDPRVHHGV